MQISVKTPAELSLPLLEKCAVCAEQSPSFFLQDCVWQCMQWMDMPHQRFFPLGMVEKYYRACGRENELHQKPSTKEGDVIQQLAKEDRIKRAKEADKRLSQFRAQLRKKPAPKHLHLKISQGMGELPQKIKAKAEWLRITPNALVMACLRDSLAAMDDPKKALVPPPIVVEFWVISNAKLRPSPKDVTEAMVLETFETILRDRGGPILDTIVRLALAEKWDTPLDKILRDADVLTEAREMKSRHGPLRR